MITLIEIIIFVIIFVFIIKMFIRLNEKRIYKQMVKQYKKIISNMSYVGYDWDTSVRIATAICKRDVLNKIKYKPSSDEVMFDVSDILSCSEIESYEEFERDMPIEIDNETGEQK